jgi:lysozyme family protein
MPTYGEYWPAAAKRWDAMQRTRMSALTAAANKAITNKHHYMEAAHKTGVPWAVIACIHMRESDFDFSAQLAQGDPLNKVSTHVPRGMGPYFGEDAWDRAAIEALERDGLDSVKDWRIEKALYYFEKYNGWGYFSKGRVSPYVWAGSNQYVSGKYVSDGVYDAGAVDQQLGCAPLLRTIIELDATAAIPREEGDGQLEPTPEQEPIPVPTQPPVIMPPPPRVDANIFADVIRQLGPIIADQIKTEMAKPETQAAVKGAISTLLPKLLSAVGVSVPGVGIIMMVASYVLPLLMPEVMGHDGSVATFASGLGVTGIPIVSKLLGVLDRFKAPE